MTNCHHANVHMAIFYNGAIEPTRFADWVKTQMKHKQNVNQVMKHLTKRMTPPPKAFWLPPCSLRTMLRLALRSLRLEPFCLLAFLFLSFLIARYISTSYKLLLFDSIQKICLKMAKIKMAKIESYQS